MHVVYVYPADAYGCGAYRLIWPAEALRAQGFDVRIIPPSARTGIGGQIDNATGKLVDVDIPADADVVVMQRVSLSHLVDAIPLIRRRGVAVVVDMDDDLDKIDPSNPAFVALHPRAGRDQRHTWVHAGKACLQATMVTVSTPSLAGVYAPHGRCAVLRNRVPERFLSIEHVDSATIGWPGSVHSHPLDLQRVGPAVARLVREGIGYRGVGPPEGLRQALGLDTDPEVTGNVDLASWGAALATLGVGIAPLADTAFNASKSWLKPLEMSTVGVPWVASPRAEYVALSRENPGLGLMAETPKDWYRQIKRLALSADLREDQSARGRLAGAANTIEAHAWRWMEAWTDALSIQRRVGSPLTRRNGVA